MERHEEVFFSLLRSALWGTPVEVPADFKDWKNVVKIAKAQSVFGLVGNVMITDPDLSARLSDKAIESLKTFIMTNILTFEKQSRALANVVSTLRWAGVIPVLMKGLSLAQYYPMPNLRQCGDIDLYVGRKDYIKTYDFLKPISSQIDDIRKLDIGIHFDAVVDGTDIEVHRYTETYPTRRFNSVYQAASDKGMTKGLTSMDVLDIKVNTPSDVFNAFYIFGHLFRHFLFEGVGFRQLCDWMMFIHARSSYIDHEELKSLIESMDMMKPWQTYGCVLVDVQGLPKEEFPLYDPIYKHLVDRVVRRILEEGNFGKKRDIFTMKGESYLANKSRNLFAHFTRTYQLFSVFPKHAFRQLWHTLAESVLRVWTDLKIKMS